MNFFKWRERMASDSRRERVRIVGELQDIFSELETIFPKASEDKKNKKINDDCRLDDKDKRKRVRELLNDSEKYRDDLIKLGDDCMLKELVDYIDAAKAYLDPNKK